MDGDRARGARYPGENDPCEVPPATPSQSGEQRTRDAGLAAAENKRFWELGPYYVWNTSPLRECAINPSAMVEDDGREVPFYITYPARASPSESLLAVGANSADVASGPFPLIVFAHANNDRVCQIFDGYYSLHDHWASWGFVVASVDSTRWNCQRGNRENIERRVEDQRAVLDAMLAMNQDPESPFYQRIDGEKVIFAGHSRGGGASLLNASRVRGTSAVINLQGISLQNYGFGSPDITAPMMGITAGNDVDLNFPAVEGNEELADGPYTWLDFAGAIHAWTADTSPEEFDDTPRLIKAEQQDLTEFFTTAHLLHHVGSPAFARGDLGELLFSYKGAQVAEQHILDNVVRMRWSEHPAESILIDNFQVLGRQDTNLLGGERQMIGFTRSQVTYAYNPERLDGVFNPTIARGLWLETLRWPGLLIEPLSPNRGGHLEVPSDWRLRARVRARTDWSAPVIRVEVVFADGTSAFLDDARSSARPQQPPIPDRYVQIDAALRPEEQAASPPETLRLREVRLHVDDGTLILDDLRLTPP